MIAYVFVLLIMPQSVFTASAQDNPYAPEISVNCDYLADGNGDLVVRKDTWSMNDDFYCSFYNDNTIDVTVEITWEWAHEAIPDPDISNGDSINIAEQSSLDLSFDLSASPYTSPEKIDFIITSRVTHYGQGLIECTGCESQEDIVEINIMPWVSISGLEITEGDIFSSCDEDLDDDRNILYAEAKYHGNAKEIHVKSVLQVSGYYDNADGRLVNENGDFSGSNIEMKLEHEGSSEKTINMEFSFAMDLDKQRYDDSSLHAYIYLQIYPQSTCWLNSLGSYCDGGQNWVYMECDLESNSVESSETPEPEMDKPNDSSILPWFSTTWTIVLVAFCALIHRKVN